MYIAIRKEPNGTLYMDRYFFNRYNDSDLARYNYTKTEVPEKFFDDFTLNDFNEDLTFSYDKYNQRKEKQRLEEYKSLIVGKIRQRYTIDQEFAVLRQRDSKPEEFYEYNTYVEMCKAEAKAKFNL